MSSHSIQTPTLLHNLHSHLHPPSTRSSIRLSSFNASTLDDDDDEDLDSSLQISGHQKLETASPSIDSILTLSDLIQFQEPILHSLRHLHPHSRKPDFSNHQEHHY